MLDDLLCLAKTNINNKRRRQRHSHGNTELKSVVNGSKITMINTQTQQFKSRAGLLGLRIPMLAFYFWSLYTTMGRLMFMSFGRELVDFLGEFSANLEMTVHIL